VESKLEIKWENKPYCYPNSCKQAVKTDRAIPLSYTNLISKELNNSRPPFANGSTENVSPIYLFQPPEAGDSMVIILKRIRATAVVTEA
jgi:hypothetical protein